MTLCAADIMSTHVVMVPREMSMPGAARMLARANVTGAPVVDATGRCIGVLSTTDFMRWVEMDDTTPHAKGPMETMCKPWQMPESAFEPNCRVEDVMTRDPVLVAPGTKIGELARMMMDAHIHRLIVVDAVSKRPLGIVSSMDVLAAVARAEQHAKEDEPTAKYATAGSSY
jgi:CBS-domain-containing membrane protein